VKVIRPFDLGLASLLAVTLAGCASTSAPTSDSSASGLNLPSLTSLAPTTGATTTTPAAPSATELYARIARGANSCWFGSGGLKKNYIYNAEADAPSRGGKADIFVHVRDPAQPNPRGAKAFHVAIEPAGDTANVKTENLKMPEPIAAAMTADVQRWTKGDQGCASTSTASGWGPAPAAATQPAAAQPVKAKAKPAAAKAIKKVAAP
jgi:hypothetical protein